MFVNIVYVTNCCILYCISQLLFIDIYKWTLAGQECAWQNHNKNTWIKFKGFYYFFMSFLIVLK